MTHVGQFSLVTAPPKAFAKYDATDLYLELKPFMDERIEQEKLVREHFEKRCKISDEHLQHLAVRQVRAVAGFDPTQMIWDMVDITVSEKERDAELRRYMAERKKRRKPQP